MPLNADAEFFIAKEKYEKAKTLQEKIKALEELISKAPTHKGAEKLRAQLKKKLAELKEKREAESRKKGGSTNAFSIRKTGVAQIVLVGYPGSGKSTVLAAITNARPKISETPYTTKFPEIGTMKFQGLDIQVVEVPAITPGCFDSGRGELFALIRNGDVVAIVLDSRYAKEQFEGVVSELKKANILGKKIVVVANKQDLGKALLENCPYEVIHSSKDDRSSLLRLGEIAWLSSGKIKLYTRKGEITDPRPFVLDKGSTVKDAVKTIHKELLDTFRFARVWRKNSPHSGSRVGLDFVLQDEDIIEIFSK